MVLDRRHPKKDLTIPLRLRIYHKRKYKEYTLGISIFESDWDDQLQQVLTSNKFHKIFNTKITSIKAKVLRKIMLSDEEICNLSPEEILTTLKGENFKRIIKKNLTYLNMEKIISRNCRQQGGLVTQLFIRVR
ncbi:MAG: Arm DNA-binding domain-containing protein [Chitinophagales bacterium]